MTDQETFLDKASHLAFYGASRRERTFGRDILAALRILRPDLSIMIVHPSGGVVAGQQAVTSAAEVQPPPTHAVVVLSPAKALPAIEDAARAGVKNIWLVMNAASRGNIERARNLGMAVVKGCPLLFTPGQAFPHTLHRALARLFGKA